MAEDKTPASPSDQSAPAKANAAKAKSDKPPAIEKKPFGEFIEQHYLPALSTALGKAGFDGVELTFQQAALAVTGADAQEYWQVTGQLATKARKFGVVFTQPDITSSKFFYCTEGDDLASTLEHFMGDERRITLDLMVLYTLQRLNGQKWLTRN
ncbi:MAG: DUF2996 domain-containing protein [Cyanobacteria bacterium]|nr:DUF2996 domain-containing protein [Cyanobacteriota bacterium]